MPSRSVTVTMGAATEIGCGVASMCEVRETAVPFCRLVVVAYIGDFSPRLTVCSTVRSIVTVRSRIEMQNPKTSSMVVGTIGKRVGVRSRNDLQYIVVPSWKVVRTMVSVTRSSRVDAWL